MDKTLELLKEFKERFDTEICKYNLTSPVIQFLLEAMEEVRKDEREKIIKKANEYSNSVAPIVKARNLGIDPDLNNKINAFHRARWLEFIQSLSEKKKEK